MMTLIFPASEKTATMDTVLQLGQENAMAHTIILAECWTLVANPNEDFRTSSFIIIYTNYFFLLQMPARITVMNATHADGGARQLMQEYVRWSLNCLCFFAGNIT